MNRHGFLQNLHIFIVSTSGLLHSFPHITLVHNLIFLFLQNASSPAEVIDFYHNHSTIDIQHPSTVNQESIKSLIRARRDEYDDPGRAFGRGIGYYVGEPCSTKCNAILYKIYCNHTTHKCECLPEYPINLEKRLCIKALKLGEACEEHHSCHYTDPHSTCSPQTGTCTCIEGYHADYLKLEQVKCVAGLSVYYDVTSYLHVLPYAAIIAVFMLCSCFLCFAYKVFGKSQNGLRDSRIQINRSMFPSPIKPTPGLELLSSVSCTPGLKCINHDATAPKASSYNLLAPPLFLGSRRPSTSSGASFRSLSSLRSQASFRNYRPTSSPKENPKYNSPSTPSPVVREAESFVTHSNNHKGFCTLHMNSEQYLNSQPNKKSNWLKFAKR